MSIGRVYPPEWQSYADPQSGRLVRQLTTHGHNYHLYFYNPSVTPDGRQVVFTANQGGLSNVYRVDWEAG